MSDTTERRRYGEAYRPVFARVVGEAALGSETRVSGNTLTLGWRPPPAAGPDAGKPNEKAKPKTRLQGRK